MPTRDVKGSKRSVVVYQLMRSTSSYIAAIDIMAEVFAFPLPHHP